MAQVQILYAATQDGVILFADPGATGRWRVVDRALGGANVVAVCASPIDPLHAAAATSDGIYETRDGGASWQHVHTAAMTGLVAMPDGTFYGGTTNGEILAHVAGVWKIVHQGPAEVARLRSLSGGQIVAIYRDGVIEILTDSVWAAIETRLSHPANLVNSVDAPQERFVVGGDGLETPTGVMRSDNETTGALVLLAGKPEVLLYGTRGPLQRSDDGGAHFTLIDPPTDVQVLVTPKHYQDQVFAGTGSGELWFSRDRARTWKRLSADMAGLQDLSFARVM